MVDSESRRTFTIGMPQMAAGHLSENWLLKELGSLHWDRLCRSLQRKSHELDDAQGRRLYATFVRVRLQLAGTLADFHEGDELRLVIEMNRFGRSTLMSSIAIEGDSSAGTATLMSTFSFRTEANNTSLAKSEPVGDYETAMASLQEAPSFFTEYSDIRRSFGRRPEQGYPSGGRLYQINPFTDSNGANLLYFASYQSIHDFLSGLHLLDYSTHTRDIYYFRNCELDDQISLAPTSTATFVDDHIRRSDILHRASDGEPIAFVISEKERIP